MVSGPVLLLVSLGLIALGALIGVGGVLYVWFSMLKDPEQRGTILKSAYETHMRELGPDEPRICPACGQQPAELFTIERAKAALEEKQPSEVPIFQDAFLFKVGRHAEAVLVEVYSKTTDEHLVDVILPVTIARALGAKLGEC